VSLLQILHLLIPLYTVIP